MQIIELRGKGGVEEALLVPNRPQFIEDSIIPKHDRIGFCWDGAWPW